MTDEHDMAARGKVSIWVGDFSDETEALDYVESEEGFGQQFGCVLKHSRELATFDQSRSLRQLLEGFSSWSDFVEEAVLLQPKEALARCAVVAYACDYHLLGFTPRAGRMQFVGVARFGKNEKS